MIQQMLTISSLVLLPFLNTACTSGSSWFTYCWSLTGKDFEHYFASTHTHTHTHTHKLCSSLNIVWHCPSLGLNDNWPFPVLWLLLTFQNLLTYWVHHFHRITFRICNSSAGIPSSPLALFVAMFSKAHLSSHLECLVLGEWLHHCGYLDH